MLCCKRRARAIPFRRLKLEILPVDKLKLTGATLAAAVGAIFISQPLMAGPSQGQAQQAKVKCVGGNSCKGQSECATAASGCKGQNSCKGKGWITTSNAQQCQQLGGKAEPENS
jgi:hypothetical protein